MSQAFYRKWRPGLWDEVVGQEHVIHTLQNSIRSGRVAHAYLFSGPRGTGKTTTARLLAKAVNCLAEDPASRPCNQCENCLAVNNGSFLDLIEIDAASNTSVDDVRDLRDKINFSPSHGQYKVYIIDEVHMLSTAAFNALLKTLEEPPAHAIFILATTESHKIPATVISRCQRHEFRRIAVQDIVKLLQEISVQEKLDVELDALTLIARQATGALRDAISLLDQLAAVGEKITLAMAQNVLGTATSQAVVNLIEALLERNTAAGLVEIHRSLDAGSDPRQFARQVVEYLRGLMLIKMGNTEQVDATQDIKKSMTLHAQGFSLESLVQTIRLFNAAANETRSNWQPNLLLELAFAEAVQPPSTPSVTIVPKVETTQPAGVEKTVQATIKQAVPEESGDNPALFKEITQNWAKIRSQVRKQKPSTEALLNSCRPMQVKDGVLYLGFASENVKTKMESTEHILLATQVIGATINKPVQIQCVVTKSKGGLDPTDPGYEGDGMVNTALNLGGQIVQKNKE